MIHVNIAEPEHCLASKANFSAGRSATFATWRSLETSLPRTANGAVQSVGGSVMPPTARFYVSGGTAFASLSTTVPTTGIAIDGDGAHLGWTVESGVDYAFANIWSAGIEYRYSQFAVGTFTYPIAIPSLGPHRTQAGDEQQSGFFASRLQGLTLRYPFLPAFPCGRADRTAVPAAP